ncbi:MAG: apolipoprotein acyltransferase, partial [Pirellulales bacterium]|nr:apolipoprotein acyltransferase [Pirellulales bacterium]
ATALGAAPAVRILEGIPPKHPKDEREKSNLLKTFQQDATVLVERIDTDPVAAMLRPAFYFTACDAMLRDYLMWPLYVAATGLDDPFASYFQLWRHGVKYRIFGETQIDFYLPRPAGRNGSAQ